MATRSSMSILKEDGTVEQIYGHWDGNISHNGVILLTHYKDIEKVKGLISLGNVSTLDKEIYPSYGSNHEFDKREEGVCNFYGRDRGDEGVGAKKFENYKTFLENGDFQGHDYVFKETRKKWYFLWKDSFEADYRLVPLYSLVKKNAQNLEYCKEEFWEYEKEKQTRIQYKKLQNDLPTQEHVKKKIKL